jgi:hypothetical protein
MDLLLKDGELRSQVRPLDRRFILYLQSILHESCIAGPAPVPMARGPAPRRLSH